MDLFEEEILKPKKKKGIKMSTLIIIAIIILFLLCFVIIAAILYLRGTILTITVDEAEADILRDVFIIEENNEVYIPIRKMGEYLKYETYNGDYKRPSEDANKCYIKSTNEIVSFVLNSNIITRVVNGQTQQIKISEPIIQINNQLCITSKAAEEAFNIYFNYDTKQNKINIITLSNLYTRYSNFFVNKGYVAIENETLDNKRAIFDGYVIVKGTNGYYGVMTAENDSKVILETKYESIKYLKETSDFLVSSNKKYGIISIDQTTKVNLAYDGIERITNKENIFYVVKESNLYGLLDSNGKVVIYPEYKQIGMDVTAYARNGVTNGYILYDELIPVKDGEKWALFNIKGEKVTDFIYDGFGSNPKGNSTTYGVLEVQDYKLLIGKQGEKYDLITTTGTGLFKGFILDSVYITVNAGVENYYIAFANQKIELMNFLEENNVQKVTENEI